jgi:death on curing protein
MAKQRSTVRVVTLTQVQSVAHILAQEMMSWDEPIPPFETRFPEVLESCLNTPFQKFDKKSLYRGLVGKGSILFYLMVKNHPFQNGNKRVAVMTLLYFLFKNGYWLDVDNDGLYAFAIEVAESKPEARVGMMKKIRAFVRKHLTPASIAFPPNE